MWSNIGKSIFLLITVSIGALILSYIVSPLFNEFVWVAVGLELLVCVGSLVAYVLFAKRWLTKQRSVWRDLLSIIIVPVLAGVPVSNISKPPYGPTLTLYNAYLAPLENIAQHFNSLILSNHYMLVLEVVVPPLLMWIGLTLKRTSQ